MQENCIAVSLESPGLDILWQRELKDHFEVTVPYQRDGAIYPKCGVITTEVRDRRHQRKQDRRLRDKVVFVMLIKRRFRSLFCGRVFIPELAQHVYLPAIGVPQAAVAMKQPSSSPGGAGGSENYFHSPRPELRDIGIDGDGVQGIVIQNHAIPRQNPWVTDQRLYVSYLVAAEVEFMQAGEVRQSRDVTYLITMKPEKIQAGEVRQSRDITYVIIVKLDMHQAGGKAT